MDQVTIYLRSNQSHLSQVLSGFFLLQKKGLAKLKFQYGAYEKWYPYLETTINDIPVVFDVSDSSIIQSKLYENCAFYFKRMCLTSELATHKKLRPLGFNYCCFTPGFDFYRIFSNILPATSKAGLLDRIRYIPFISNVLKIPSSVGTSQYNLFENNDDADRKFFIQFSCRLWNPANTQKKELIAERLKMNEERIALVRLLKKSFANYYKGGIEGSDFTLQRAPDTIMQQVDYKKSNYMQRVKNSSVGIATPGLEDSIGWKFGEYIAAGLAVLTTPEFLKYSLPGKFAEGENFLLFDTVDKCAELLEQLENDPELLKHLMNSNTRYYQQYLRPDQLVSNCIHQVKMEN